MLTFIAGATITGARVAKNNVVRKSSAKPVSEFCQEVGGCRRDYQRFGRLRFADVLYR